MNYLRNNKCPYCGSKNLHKNGHSENMTQRWRCVECKKSFQLSYLYNARKPEVKTKIIELTTTTGKGVRDISRILNINKNTVVSVLKNTNE